MAQQPVSDFPIDPVVTSGTELADIVNRFNQAFNSMNAGPTRPPTLGAGGIWSKIDGVTNKPLFFDGTTDYGFVYNDAGLYNINIIGNAGFATNAGNSTTSDKAINADYATSAGSAGTVTNGVYNDGGTYSINITGNAGFATNAGNATNADTAINSSYATKSGSVTSIDGAGGGTLQTELNIQGQLVVAVGSNRPFTIQNGTGATYHRAQAGGWNLQYAFSLADGTPFGGFGASGQDNTPGYFYVANDAVTAGVTLPYGGNAWATISDITQKTLSGEIENALSKLTTLRSVYYNYNTDAPDARRRVGLIAQEVQAVLPEAVTAITLDVESKSAISTLTIAYTDVIPLLVSAIKELKAEIEALKAAR